MVNIDAFLNEEKFNDQTFDVPVRILVKKDSFRNRPLRVGNNSSVLSFTRCTFNNLVSISSDENFEDDILISFSGCIIDSFETDLIKSDKVTISLFSCFNERFLSRNGVAIKINISNCFGRYFFDNCSTVNVSYTGENIFPRIWKLITNKYKNVFQLETSYDFEKVESVKLYSNIFEKKKKEERAGFELKQFEQIKDYKLRYNPNEQEINLLNISFTLNYDFEFEHKKTLITSSRLHNLTLNGKANGELKIENTKVENVYMRNFSPTNEFKFYQIEPMGEKGKFEIHESILDNSWFDNVKLNKYKIISFFRSSLSNTKFTSTIFPSRSIDFESFQSLKNVHYPDEKSDSYYRDQYEVFLQLKLALLKTGNTYEAQRMQRISFNALQKVKGLSYWNEKFILCLNKLSNAHGFSPWRAFGWILLFSILFYLLYLRTLGFLSFKTEFDPNLIGYYFSFLDITHKSNFLVDKEELNGCAISIDFANKIIFGYLIYQFVTAFRKFGKK